MRFKRLHLDVEECWTLIGQRVGPIWRARLLRHRVGQRVTVTADGRWTLAREESRGDVIGFFHTHPDGDPTPSTRDVRTFRAWCDALGKPLLCAIGVPRSGVMALYSFDNYRSRGIRIPAGRLIISRRKTFATRK